MANVLMNEVDYKIEETPLGVWKRYVSDQGWSYHEFTSHARPLGLPLIHYTSGICPEYGRRKTAIGWLAVGRKAVGGIAIGQLALGLVAICQAGVGAVFGLGQAVLAFVAVGQLAAGLLAGAGQIAAGYYALGQGALGYIAVGQGAVGKYVLAAVGWGAHKWTTEVADPAAVEMFRGFVGFFTGSG